MAHRLATPAILLVVLLAPCIPAGEQAFRQGFDGPATNWQLLDSGVAARVLAHEIVPHGIRGDVGAERIVVAAAAGQSVLLSCTTAAVAVLDETEVRLWVKASRPDVQLAARVRLPRSATAGEAGATLIVRGAAYTRPGQWQQLVLKDFPKLLSTQVRVMRATSGAAIDPREALVDAVLLVVPGEPGGVEVVTDDLVVDGIVKGRSGDVQLATHTAAAPGEAAIAPAGTAAARLQGESLFVEDRPFLPRVIRWQGEPMAFLAERGFNVLQLPGPPTDEQIAEAGRHGLWFVCTPPRPDLLAAGRLGRGGDRVLAWYLDDEAVDIDANFAARWAELVRNADAAGSRPIAVAPESNWTTAGNSADILLARHARISVLNAADYHAWLAERTRLARSGAPLWACFATQFSEMARRQIAALEGEETAVPNVDAERLESLVWDACTRGVRGFMFDSSSSLSGQDEATIQRAAVLELINRRLQLIEPWLAAGNIVARLQAAEGDWSGIVLQADRTRLVMQGAGSGERGAGSTEASRSSLPASRPALHAPRPSPITLVVPGVSESSQAFLLTPAALQALPIKRVAGGGRLELPSGDALVVIADEAQAIHGLRERVAQHGPRIVRLQRELAAWRAAAITQTAHRLAEHGYQNEAAARIAVWANAQLPQVDALVAAGRLEQAQQLVDSVAAVLRQTALGTEGELLNAGGTLRSNPLALSYGQAAADAAFARAIGTRRGGENLLYGGDFEDLGRMSQAGWQQFRHPMPGVETRVELSSSEPQQGRYCLSLDCSAAGAVLSAPVWIQSPAIPVAAGQIVEISGWLRIDKPIAGGEGLQIVDSLGGAELSLVVPETAGWQPFQLIRAAPENTEVRLAFALAGVGTARVDAVMVRVLEPQALTAR